MPWKIKEVAFLYPFCFFQSLSSEDELDVTVEVCRPSTSPAEEKHAGDNSLSGM